MAVKPKTRLDRIIQLLIPPSLILLLVVTIIELFYGIGKLKLFIDIFDTYIIIIFAIDLYYRWQDTPHFWPYLKKHILDIIATIPFNLIFWGIQGVNLIRALRGARAVARGVRVAARSARLARYTRFLRYLRFGARAPRFLRTRKQIKKTKIRKVQPHQKQLKATLSFKVILLITINSIMGTGIWFLTSAGAKHAGPASLISWGILSVIAIYIAMCFSELTAMFPKAGGVYEFAKQTYGRFWSFVIGWTTAIAGSVTIAMLLLGALQYLIPLQYSYLYIPIAIGLILIFSFVAFRGMNTSKFMLVTFALITLVAVLGIIIPGLINFDPANYKPFFVFPTIGIALAIFFIAETFFGWESAIFLSAETKNPTKVMPKALIWGTVVIAILAFLLAFTAMGTINWETYAESAAPLRDLGQAHFGSIGRVIFTFLIFVSVIGATAGWIVTAPRLLMSIAEDKLFFIQFSKIHPKRKSPYVSIIFQVFVVSALVIVGAGSYETLLHMLIPLIIVLYSAVLLAVAILRFKKPEIKRPYKVFAGKIGPFLTIGFMVFLLVMFIRETHGALDILRVSASLILFGIPAYFTIELFYDKKYVTIRRNFVAHLSRYATKIPLPQPVFNKLISTIGPLNSSKVIMAYNAPIGAFTKHLLKKKLPFKHVYVANQSKEEIKVFREQIRSHKKIDTIFLPNLFVPNKKIDIFVSFHTLGYVKNIEDFIKQMKKSLKPGGKFCFYVKSRFFDIAPNSVEIENRKKMQEIFRKHRLKMDYFEKKRFYKREIYISGKR
jgi:basic amino acid/polyamine antiporter, APA family